MQMYLKGNGLWGVVAEDIPIAEDKKDMFQKAHIIIVLHLLDSQLLHVVQLKSAKQAWLTLQELSNTNEMPSKMYLKERFSTFKYEVLQSGSTSKSSKP
jgi:hypothetical protein